MDSRSPSDNGIRADTSLEALAALRPVFDRRYGSVTAGNSSPLTDGAAAVLLMAEEKAAALGYRPLAFLRSYAVAAVDPGWQLLMGPVYAVPKALERAGISLERHRACSRSTRRSPPRCSPTSRPGARRPGPSGWDCAGPVGEVDWDRTNVMGGSIAIGHPFAATGARLVTTLANEMRRRGRAVRAGLDLRPGRHGVRDGAGAGRLSMSAFTTELQDSIAVVTFDLPGEPVNKLTSAVKVEFEALLIRLRDDAEIRGVVLISGKPDTFIAGADIEEFTALTTQAEAERLSFEGQEMVSRVETLPKPVVAAIHGACLGGGLELALACHYRIATDHPKTQLGLPEVQLGLIPGAGGSQRLPRLIGLRAALDMILTGKSERAAKALRLGLVDEVVPRSILRRTAVAAASRLVRDGLPRRNPPRRTLRLLPRPHPGRPPAGLSRREGPGAQADRRPLPRAARRAGGGAGRAGARDHRRPRRGAPRVRPARGGRGVPQAGADLLRHDRAQEGRRHSRRRRQPAADPAARRGRLRLHGRRGSRALRCSTSRWIPGSRTPTSPGWGRDSAPRPRSSPTGSSAAG